MYRLMFRLRNETPKCDYTKMEAKKKKKTIMEQKWWKERAHQSVSPKTILWCERTKTKHISTLMQNPFNWMPEYNGIHVALLGLLISKKITSSPLNKSKC